MAAVASSTLILDTLNILHAWGLMRQPSPQIDPLIVNLARQCLPLCDAKGWTLWLAIDQRAGVTREEKPSELSGVTLAFADAGLTADGLIEQRLRRATLPQIVVSDDRAVQRAAWVDQHTLWSPVMLKEEIKAARQMREDQAARQAHGPLRQGLFG